MLFFCFIFILISRRNTMAEAKIQHIARYIVNRVGLLTAMKLEKLTYYCQAWSLAWDNEPLFDEDFQAWANGPVCYELYKEHRGQFRIDKDFLEEYEGFDFTESQKETMDIVISDYGRKKAWELSEMTHNEMPWKKAREISGVEPGEATNEIIQKEDMLEFYGGLV